MDAPSLNVVYLVSYSDLLTINEKVNIIKKKKAERLSSALVPVVGVEPTRYCYLRILSPTRLPIPPYRRLIHSSITEWKNQVLFSHR